MEPKIYLIYTYGDTWPLYSNCLLLLEYFPSYGTAAFQNSSISLLSCSQVSLFHSTGHLPRSPSPTRTASLRITLFFIETLLDTCVRKNGIIYYTIQHRTSNDIKIIISLCTLQFSLLFKLLECYCA
jgi:hypothetical protein